MAPHAIISYDDTQNDHDALMLGRILADAGAQLTLAYVRHTTQRRADREELEDHEAEALLERGARWLERSRRRAPRRRQRLDRRRPRLAGRAGAGRHHRVRLRLPHRRRPRLAGPLGADAARARPGRAGHRPGRLSRRPRADDRAPSASFPARPTRRRSRRRSRSPSASTPRSSTGARCRPAGRRLAPRGSGRPRDGHRSARRTRSRTRPPRCWSSLAAWRSTSRR